ncbi:PAS domain S-box-containing protein [Algoriphagus ratkowskyi]|uniref:histidine kinase n=1 Tax=Algoriphagus ratkowskyi TaxID=57028 RepID=A0A2W7R8Z3_9BACT|nr:PAS domain-containing sensor histidine kinase [Algoriphagus ratkowskyi]PZX52147.1 PAS domain S-box-containing protein [Algoriphagus ratkowskyi]TXD76091.1 GHKL domain-containing protein [Algoriphagus ratkowskyi]
MDTKKLRTKIFELKVADHITAMLAYWDKNLVCRFANSAYIDWFGKTQEEMIDKITVKELLGTLYEMNLPFISAVLKGEVQTFEREIPTPTGGTRHSLANYYPDIVNGEVVGFYVHVADVSSLKLLEIELLKSNHRVNEQNKRLLNFSNIVSHDLKSYANNISSILDLINQASSEDEKSEMFELLKVISKEFSRTVNHLNEITRSQNLAKLNPELINLNELVEKTKMTLLVQIHTSNAIITNTIDIIINVLANPVYMESIILNLLTNAIKYRQQTKPPIVEVSCTQELGKTILKVKDNGKGIDLEKHGADLFGMYKTFHGNSDAQGIGLFITKNQIEEMGGQIEVESKENVGTTFTVTFNAIPN